ncbi:MAG: hypothetical protein WAV38_21195 [Xanthobacteraceae bacterium]
MPAIVSANAVSAAERTKRRQSCRVLADLNKHGGSFFVFVFCDSPPFFALKPVSVVLTAIFNLA